MDSLQLPLTPAQGNLSPLASTGISLACTFPYTDTHAYNTHNKKKSLKGSKTRYIFTRFLDLKNLLTLAHLREVVAKISQFDLVGGMM